MQILKCFQCRLAVFFFCSWAEPDSVENFQQSKLWYENR